MPSSASISRASRRVGAYGATVALASLVSLIALPVLVASIGAEQWGHLALTQSVALFAGVVVAFGWPVTGPTAVASSAPDARPALFAASIPARLALFALALPTTAVVLALLLRGDVVLAVLGGLTYLLPSLNANWYFIGDARPWRMFALDAVPGAVGTITGIIAVTLTHSVAAYLACQLAGYVVAVLVSWWRIMRDGRWPAAGWRPRQVAGILAQQRHAATATISSSVYIAVPLVAVQIWLPALLPVYALADRLLRYAAICYGPVQQYFQGWVPAGGAGQVVRRTRLATWTGAAIGVLGAIALVVLAGPVSYLLSHGEVVVPLWLSTPLAIAFIGVALSATVGYACLPALGNTRAVARATTLGLVVGVPAVVVSAILGLPPGVAWAVALTEGIVALYQVIALRRAQSGATSEPQPPAGRQA